MCARLIRLFRRRDARSETYKVWEEVQSRRASAVNSCCNSIEAWAEKKKNR